VGLFFARQKRQSINWLKLSYQSFFIGSIARKFVSGIRDRIMEQFREGHINILVATDFARGIDVKEISMWSTTIYLTFMKLTFTAAEELPELEQRAFINRIASRRGSGNR
jgi:hypothetical protein